MEELPLAPRQKATPPAAAGWRERRRQAQSPYCLCSRHWAAEAWPSLPQW